MTPTCTPTLTKWISIRAVDAGWVRRQRETGSIAPGKMGGHRIWVWERIRRAISSCGGWLPSSR
jgi:hypothetical protein